MKYYDLEPLAITDEYLIYRCKVKNWYGKVWKESFYTSKRSTSWKYLKTGRFAPYEIEKLYDAWQAKKTLMKTNQTTNPRGLNK